MGDSGTNDQKIKVFRLQIFGSWIIFGSMKGLIDSLECDLESLEDSNENDSIEIEIECVYMTQHEYENLPEFEGY